MKEGQFYVVSTAVWFGIVLLFISLVQPCKFLSRLPLLFVIPPVMGGVTVLIHRVISWGLGRGVTVLYGGSAGGKAPPGLSRVRAAIIRYDFDSARVELDAFWAAHPGNGEVLREYERLFAALEAPAGMAEQFEKCLPALKGEPLEYALIRLAEVYAGKLDGRDRAAILCRRLLSESPGSVHSPMAGELLERLEKSSG